MSLRKSIFAVLSLCLTLTACGPLPAEEGAVAPQTAQSTEGAVAPQTAQSAEGAASAAPEDRAGGRDTERRCDYTTCMYYCTRAHTFDYCHSLCKGCDSDAVPQ